ncbi:MAG: single-stranded DNA-binding protein [Bacteroidetes bacterium]|nr:MAG: single-stranded DNA-binding protein [Bacteroidota bacterium]
MINKVILIGNLGRDPEVRHLEGGVSVAKFSVATNESYQDKNQQWQTVTEWHDVVVWRGLAERAERQLHKGSLVYIEGKLTHRKWQDKDGKDRYNTEVVANTFRSLDRKESTQQSRGTEFPAESPYSSSTVPETTTATSTDTVTAQTKAETADDLPF